MVSFVVLLFDCRLFCCLCFCFLSLLYLFGVLSVLQAMVFVLGFNDFWTLLVWFCLLINVLDDSGLLLIWCILVLLVC